MNRYSTGLKFNYLGTVKYNSEIIRTIRQILTRIGPRPVILSQEQEAIAILENSFDIELEQEVNGIDEISFSLPFTDSKKDCVINENLVQMFETLYIIREVRKRKGSATPTLDVYAEALWYDLQFSDPLETTMWSDQPPFNVLTDILKGSGWEVGTVEIDTKRSPTLNEEVDNVLSALNVVRGLYGGNLVFDTVNKKVNLLKDEAIHSGASIVYKKNMQEIEVSYDTRNLVTKLFAYGKDGMTIEAANNGERYLENYSYTSKKRVRSIKDDRFTNPYYLKDYAEKKLNELSKPQAAYKVTAQDLSRLSGMSHEKFSIGCIVRVYDKELDLDTNPRILKWTYNVAEPWRTKIELETTIKSLSDLLTDDATGESSFSTGETVDNKEMLDLMVFNYLLNSRADDGFSYWTNSGWEIDPVNGYSGSASFKADGELGVVKQIKQTIFPSHRDSYSLSFRAFSESLSKGPNGRVGINVKITYEDETTTEQFIALA